MPTYDYECPDCGGFDVLGLRWMRETLRLSARDSCGLWTKTFVPGR